MSPVLITWYSLATDSYIAWLFSLDNGFNGVFKVTKTTTQLLGRQWRSGVTLHLENIDYLNRIFIITDVNLHYSSAKLIQLLFLCFTPFVEIIDLLISHYSIQFIALNVISKHLLIPLLITLKRVFVYERGCVLFFCKVQKAPCYLWNERWQFVFLFLVAFQSSVLLKRVKITHVRVWLTSFVFGPWLFDMLHASEYLVIM